jgi:hypothetical protein
MATEKLKINYKTKNKTWTKAQITNHKKATNSELSDHT